jgi:hypothetical protein
MRLVIAGGGRRDIDWVCRGGEVKRAVVERFLGMRLVDMAEERSVGWFFDSGSISWGYRLGW